MILGANLAPYSSLFGGDRHWEPPGPPTSPFMAGPDLLARKVPYLAIAGWPMGSEDWDSRISTRKYFLKKWNGDFHSHGCTPKWLVYNGKCQWQLMIWGYPHLCKPPSYDLMTCLWFLMKNQWNVRAPVLLDRLFLLPQPLCNCCSGGRDRPMYCMVVPGSTQKGRNVISILGPIFRVFYIKAMQLF